MSFTTIPIFRCSKILREVGKQEILQQCSENSKSQIVFRTHIFRKLSLGAPEKKNVYIYIYLSGFHTRCLYWVSRRSSPRSHYSPSPPMKLMTSQSLPPSSASSVMIMSHRIDLAGLGHGTNFLTLHCCFLTQNSNQSDKISPSYPPGSHTKQSSHPPTDRSGPGLSTDT